MSRRPAQARTRSTRRRIRAPSRCGLIAPPSHSRLGTARASASHTFRPTSLTHSSSAWTCPRSTWPCCTRCSCTCWQCCPARACQAATVAQQRQHHRDQVGGVLQAEEGRAGGGGEGPSTGGTAIAAFGLAMHADVALAALASGRTVRVGAELGLRVHAGPPPAVVCRPHAEGCHRDPPPCHPTPCHHGSLGCYPARL